MYIVVSRARSRNAFTRSSVCLSKLPNAKMCSSERRHRERLRETERETFRERKVCCTKNKRRRAKRMARLNV